MTLVAKGEERDLCVVCVYCVVTVCTCVILDVTLHHNHMTIILTPPQTQEVDTEDSSLAPLYGPASRRWTSRGWSFPPTSRPAPSRHQSGSGQSTPTSAWDSMHEKATHTERWKPHVMSTIAAMLHRVTHVIDHYYFFLTQQLHSGNKDGLVLTLLGGGGARFGLQGIGVVGQFGWAGGDWAI